MKNLNHPNILNLIGVCVDGGPAPYIVMPYMANGSLLVHLRKNKRQLVLSDNNEQEVVSDYKTHIVGMCMHRSGACT